MGLKSSSRSCGKAAGMGGVRRGHGEGLSGGAKALLENRPAPQEGETGNHPSCVQQGWDLFDLN